MRDIDARLAFMSNFLPTLGFRLKVDTTLTQYRNSNIKLRFDKSALDGLPEKVQRAPIPFVQFVRQHPPKSGRFQPPEVSRPLPPQLPKPLKTCFTCGSLAHYARQCHVNTNKRRSSSPTAGNWRSEQHRPSAYRASFLDKPERESGRSIQDKGSQPMDHLSKGNDKHPSRPTHVKAHMPNHPEYWPKDGMTADKTLDVKSEIEKQKRLAAQKHDADKRPLCHDHTLRQLARPTLRIVPKGTAETPQPMLANKIAQANIQQPRPRSRRRKNAPSNQPLKQVRHPADKAK